jgi:uncharacterized membrane protein
MNKNVLVATLSGTVILMVLGFLLYGVLLADFIASNTGSASNVMKDPPNWMFLILGQFTTALFLAIVLGWKGDTAVGAAAKTGACVGLLWGLGYGLTMYATTNVTNLTMTLVDPIVATFQFAIAGGVMGMLLGKGE